MASSISPLSYLDASPYLSLPPTSSAAKSANTGVSATSEVQALEHQGGFQAFLSDSMATALLQPADSVTTTATDANTLINNMLQQVLGAYQMQSAGAVPNGGTSVLG